MLKIPDCMHKAVGVVGVSNGMFGGGRMAESLLPVVRTLGLVSIKLDHYFPRIQDTLSEEGVSNDSATIEAFERFMQELLWMAGTLKVAREQGTK
jgi:NAD(P)H-dependent FMN reductase